MHHKLGLSEPSRSYRDSTSLPGAAGSSGANVSVTVHIKRVMTATICNGDSPVTRLNTLLYMGVQWIINCCKASIAVLLPLWNRVSAT